jgi:hypothetical protein
MGPSTYHLSCDYFCETDETLYFGPRKYIIKLIDQYENMFRCKPRQYISSLEKGDHPEKDQTEVLDNNAIKQYQTMIGCLQWAVSLGQFDIQTATMTMLQFLVSNK